MARPRTRMAKLTRRSPGAACAFRLSALRQSNHAPVKSTIVPWAPVSVFHTSRPRVMTVGIARTASPIHSGQPNFRRKAAEIGVEVSAVVEAATLILDHDRADDLHAVAFKLGDQGADVVHQGFVPLRDDGAVAHHVADP